MKHAFHTTGYSLVEVLVSIAVLLLAIVGPMTIASQGIKSAQFTLEQNTAFFLAQEGVEAVFTLRNNAALGEIDGGDDVWSWYSDLYADGGPCRGFPEGTTCTFGIDFGSNVAENNMTDNTCDSGVDVCRLYTNESGARAVFTHDSSGTPTQFRREVTVVEEQPSYAVKVTSTVFWDSHVFGGQEQSVSITSVVFDTTL